MQPTMQYTPEHPGQDRMSTTIQYAASDPDGTVVAVQPAVPIIPAEESAAAAASLIEAMRLEQYGTAGRSRAARYRVAVQLGMASSTAAQAEQDDVFEDDYIAMQGADDLAAGPLYRTTDAVQMAGLVPEALIQPVYTSNWEHAVQFGGEEPLLTQGMVGGKDSTIALRSALASDVLADSESDTDTDFAILGGQQPAVQEASRPGQGEVEEVEEEEAPISVGEVAHAMQYAIRGSAVLMDGQSVGGATKQTHGTGNTGLPRSTMTALRANPKLTAHAIWKRRAPVAKHLSSLQPLAGPSSPGAPRQKTNSHEGPGPQKPRGQEGAEAESAGASKAGMRGVTPAVDSRALAALVDGPLLRGQPLMSSVAAAGESRPSVHRSCVGDEGVMDEEALPHALQTAIHLQGGMLSRYAWEAEVREHVSYDWSNPRDPQPKREAYLVPKGPKDVIGASASDLWTSHPSMLRLLPQHADDLQPLRGVQHGPGTMHARPLHAHLGTEGWVQSAADHAVQRSSAAHADSQIAPEQPLVWDMNDPNMLLRALTNDDAKLPRQLREGAAAMVLVSLYATIIYSLLIIGRIDGILTCHATLAT